ncbi:MAG: hypothetical protein ACLFRG_13750 [Desulfococcaceae bacterium]
MKSLSNPNLDRFLDASENENRNERSPQTPRGKTAATSQKWGREATEKALSRKYSKNVHFSPENEDTAAYPRKTRVFPKKQGIKSKGAYFKIDGFCQAYSDSQ